MRIKLLDTNLEVLQLTIEDLLKHGSLDQIDLFKFTKEVYETLEMNNLNGYFNMDLESLESYRKKSSDFAWSSNMTSNFRSILTDIVFKIENLRKTISIAIDNNALNIDNIYAIKLPKFEYFDDMVNYSKAINRIFSKVFGNNKKAKLVGFDIGSEWFLIGLDSFLNFKLFAIFMNGVYSYLKRSKQDKEVLSDCVTEDSKQIMLEHMNGIKDLLIADTMKRMEELQGKSLTPEERLALEKSLIDMAKLISMGTEVHIDKQTPLNNEGNQDSKKIEIPKIETVREFIEGAEKLFLEDIDEE